MRDPHSGNLALCESDTYLNQQHFKGVSPNSMRSRVFCGDIFYQTKCILGGELTSFWAHTALSWVLSYTFWSIMAATML